MATEGISTQGNPIDAGSTDTDQTWQLSLSQREVWLDQRAWPHSVHLNIGGGTLLSGPLDLELLKGALAQLVAEHQALRLVPHPDGKQTLLSKAEPILEWVDVSDRPDPEQAVKDWWHQRIKDPFILGAAPPWRFAVIRAGEHLHGISIQFHHLVMDGWGTSLVFQRWSEIYNALGQGLDPAQSKPNSASYGEFIEESNSYRHSDAFERDASFWRGRISQLPEPLIERRQTSQKTHTLPSSRLVVHRIARADYQRISRQATQQGVTPFNLFLAALTLYFALVNERNFVVIGVPTLNRGGRRFRDTLGMFVGVMAIPISLSNQMSSAEFLSSVAAVTRAALRHPRYPLSELGRELEMIRSGRDGLFDLLLSFERQDYKLQFGDAKMTNSRQVFAGTARYPLSATVCDFNEDEDVELVLEASEACFSASEAALLGPRIWSLVTDLAEQPDARIESLSLMPDKERNALIEGIHDRIINYPLSHPATEPFIVQFERQAAQRPQASAVVWDGGSLTYGEINAMANQLAHRLIAAGAARDNIVAFAIERSADMVVSILAIAKAGAAFLPLDVDAPIARLADILKESEAVALLIQERSAERLNHLHLNTLVTDSELAHSEAVEPSPETMVGSGPSRTDLAYVLFTSGSTGRPKGVMIEHSTLSRRLAWITRTYGVTVYDRSAQATQITFDPSLIELCVPLINGASVALPPAGRLLPESLVDFAVNHGVTIMAFVPSTLSRFLDAAAHRPDLKLRVACCGGEVLPPELVNRYLSHTRAKLFNVYGPTETAIFATAWACQRVSAEKLSEPLPIGSPIDDTRIYILDSAQRLLPFGIAGEIYIGGGAVARGYLNRADLTEAVFQSDPFEPSKRVYRTGDRGWLSDDGQLHFIGRIDRQVKLRGYRIELGEIEAALSQMEGVSQAAAKLIERDGKPSLHAWVATQVGLSADGLQRALRVRLPDYMVPGGISVLGTLPESSVGKIDYAGLPAPLANPIASATYARAPNSQIEKDLLALWQEVLAQPTLGVSDNFFDHGGDSLAAVSILTGIEKLIGRRVPMYLITERPTVEGLAAALAEETATPGLLINLSPNPVGAGKRPQLYLAASGHGDLMRFQNLARALGDACDLSMLQPPSASTIVRTADLATLYADSILARGSGPCYLAGFSVGGLAALETARQLQQRGNAVNGLVLIDTIYPSMMWGGTTFWRLLGWLVRVLHIQDLSMNGRRLGVMLKDPGLVGQVMAVSGYRAIAFKGPTLLVKSAGLATWDNLLFRAWHRLMGKSLVEHRVQGLHGSMFDVGNVGDLAEGITEKILPHIPQIHQPL